LRLYCNYAREETPSAQQTHQFPCPIFHTPGASPCRHDHNHDGPRCSVPCSRMHTVGPPSATSSASRSVFFGTASSLWGAQASCLICAVTSSTEVCQPGRKAEFPKELRSRVPPVPPHSHRCVRLRTGVRINGVVLVHFEDISFCFVPWFISLLRPEHYEISRSSRSLISGHEVENHIRTKHMQIISLVSTALLQTEYRADTLSFRLSSHSPVFVLRPVCVGFMVDMMAPRQCFLHVFRFCPVTVIPSVLHSFVNLSSAVIDLAIDSVLHSKYVLVHHVALV
jgi:hypothetical protein